MNTVLLQTIIASLIGAVITVNGIGMKADDIIASAKLTANQANVHQLATALEIYYLDHNNYPSVEGGQALVSELETDGYITGRPLDPSAFKYQTKKDGQDYTLKLTE